MQPYPTFPFLCHFVLYIAVRSVSALTSDDLYEIDKFAMFAEFMQCADLRPWTGGSVETFKKLMAESANKFCSHEDNFKTCKLRSWNPDFPFDPQLLRFLPGYPDVELNTVELKFVLFYTGGMDKVQHPRPPLLPKAALSRLRYISGYIVLNYDTYPHFDPITTFMNKSLIVIGIFIFLGVIGCAKCSTYITTKQEAAAATNLAVQRKEKFDRAEIRKNKHLFVTNDDARKEGGVFHTTKSSNDIDVEQGDAPSRVHKHKGGAGSAIARSAMLGILGLGGSGANKRGVTTVGESKKRTAPKPQSSQSKTQMKLFMPMKLQRKPPGGGGVAYAGATRKFSSRTPSGLN